MDKMKRILALVMLVVMVLMMTACADKDDDDDKSSRTKVNGETAKNDLTKTPEEGETGKLPEDDDDNDGDDDQGMKGDYELDTSCTIEEICLYNENNVKITATDLSYEEGLVALHLKFENNSGEELSFMMGNIFPQVVSVNHYSITSTSVYATAKDGETVESSAYIDARELQRFGITRIADISFNVEIADEEYDTVSTPVLEVKTSIADSYDYAKDTYLDVLSSNSIPATCGYTVDYYSADKKELCEGVTVVSTAVLKDERDERYLAVELLNEREEPIYGVIQDVKINTLALGDYFTSALTTLSGARSVLMLALESELCTSYWNSYGFDSAERFDFCVEARDATAEDMTDSTLGMESMSIESGKPMEAVNSTGDVVYIDEIFEVIDKGIMNDPMTYSDDVILHLLVHNISDETYVFDATYNDSYVNENEVYVFTHSYTLAPDEYAAVVVSFSSNSLEDIKVTDAADISKVRLGASYHLTDYSKEVDADIEIDYE